VRGGVHGLVLLARQRLAHAVLPIGAGGFDEGCFDLALLRLRHTFDQSPVGLGGRTRLEDATEPGCCVAMLGDEQHTGRVAVEPMHQPGAVTETIDHSGEKAVDVPLRTGSTLHGDTERLVQHHYVLVLIDDHRLDEIAVALGKAERRRQRRLRLWRQPDDGRHAHLLAALHAHVGLGALGVDTHLARAQQLLKMAVGNVREMHAKPAVEAHAGLVARDLDGFDGSAHPSSQRVACIPA
jgi:hypothetical protein